MKPDPRWPLAVAALLLGCPHPQPAPVRCAAPCAGCCDSNGQCQSGDTAARCGAAGATCLACPTGQGCDAGRCGPINPSGCNLFTCGRGCCDAQGTCQPGTTDAVCGTEGRPCATCREPTSSCQGGACVTQCTAATCDGCCEGTTCVALASETGMHCGSAATPASACVPCGDPVNGCQGGVCQSESCPGCTQGCCQMGLCITAENASSCGPLGLDCVSCGPDAPFCAVGPDGGVCRQLNGAPCASNADCRDLDVNAVCRLQTSTGVPYPGGYCTVLCDPAGSFCPTGAGCFDAGGAFGEQSGVCALNCNTAGCPRPGYTCYGVPFSNGLCWLDPLEQVGDPCAGDGQCQSPLWAGFGFCLTRGYPGGMCSGACDGSLDGGLGPYCGDVATCQFDAGVCLRTCAQPLQGQGTCRAGYVCKPGPAGTSGVCGPRCDVDGGTPCQAGWTCDAGYCCSGVSCQ